MDGAAPVTRRRWAGAAALAVALSAACGSAPPISRTVDVPATYGVSVAETMSLEEGLDILEEDDAAIIRNRAAGEPRADLPDHALAWAGFDLDGSEDSPARASEFVVANYWPTRLRVNVICLVDGRQVPCSDKAEVWRVELDEPGMAILDLPESEGRRDVLLVEESDERVERVFPVSRVRSVDGFDAPFPVLGDPLPEIANRWGCDWALFRDKLEPRETFKLLRTVGVAPVYLLISICPEHSSYEMFPIFIVDETTVVYIEGLDPFMARPGALYAWELPDELLSAGNKIRAAVVRRAPGWGFWLTHPLITAAGPEEQNAGRDDSTAGLSRFNSKLIDEQEQGYLLG